MNFIRRPPSGSITHSSVQIVAQDNDTVLYRDLAENPVLTIPSRPADHPPPTQNRKQRRAAEARKRHLSDV